MKCEIPSFIADFVSVHSWVSNSGDEYFASNSFNNGIKYLERDTQAIFFNVLTLHLFIFAVVSQTYTSGPNPVYVILGNSALVKCEIPSFVADFVSVVSWINNEGEEYFASNSFNNGSKFCI